MAASAFAIRLGSGPVVSMPMVTAYTYGADGRGVEQWFPDIDDLKKSNKKVVLLFDDGSHVHTMCRTTWAAGTLELMNGHTQQYRWTYRHGSNKLEMMVYALAAVPAPNGDRCVATEPFLYADPPEPRHPDWFAATPSTYTLS